MITVVDYGMGNLRSVVKALELYTSEVRVSSDPDSVETSSAIVMPGDGAFSMAMEHLTDRGWVEPLVSYINKGGLFLGICLGYQLLFESSEEFGFSRGLGVIPGKVIRFRDSVKVPHMGWNSMRIRSNSRFFDGIPDESYFYFIHSFYPVLDDDSWLIGECFYDVTFPCVVGKNNVIATQFHPEKSHTWGLKIIENFVRDTCL